MASTVSSSERVLTTNHVIGETWTFLRVKTSHATAVGFFDRVEQLARQQRLTVHEVSAAQEEAARSWLRQHDELVYSFVDATSFRVMHDRRLREALAFDQDFAAAGFVEVQP
jgi:predicted nucleic acid-binding protein